MSVYIAIPSYSRQIDAGLLLASHQMGTVEASLNWLGSSLLAANFNRALCTAKAGGHDWMLMWHADLYPVGSKWLSGMVAVAEANGADVLSAVVPLKGPHGFTSTAADTLDGVRRVTMTELAQLPQEFTVEDVRARLWPCDGLLVNTGLMLVRVKKIDPLRCFFTIRDKITTDENGKHYWHVWPEDWGFSRMCNQAGVSVRATKAPAVRHVGVQEYASDAEPWGVATDPVRQVWGEAQ